jgi:hypothetical protein
VFVDPDIILTDLIEWVLEVILDVIETDKNKAV